MNPGNPVEEGGETARTLISSMKDSPMTLALVVFNLIFIVVIYLGTKDNRAAIDHLMTTMLAQEAHTADMLYNCTPNPRDGK